MPNALVIKGDIAYVKVNGSSVGMIEQWQLSLVGNGQYTITAETFKPDLTRWQFRDSSKELIIELLMKRSTQRFRGILTSEDPFACDASLDANKAEGDDFW